MISRGNVEGVLPKRVQISGSFGMQAPSRSAGEQAKAYYEFPIASGANIVVEADEGGVNGNALDFQATADGSAKASLSLNGLLDGVSDTVVEDDTGGLAGNTWKFQCHSGAAAAAGVAYVDAANLIVTFIFQNGVSTEAHLRAAVDALATFNCTGTTVLTLDGGLDDIAPTNLAGGTAGEWAAGVVGAASGAHLHFEAGTTVDEAIAFINAASSTLTARTIDGAAGAHVLAGGDAVAKQDLAQGALVNDVKGDAFGVEKNGTCVYSVGLEDTYADMESCSGTLQLNTKTDRDVIFGPFVPASGAVPPYIQIFIIDDSDGGVGAADSAVHANNRITFKLKMINTN